MQDYENVRAQFEAFLAHSTNAESPSTGTIYWQMNKGWPSLLWNLYNSDYDLAGSYFGAQKANEGVHALFATDTDRVSCRQPHRQDAVRAVGRGEGLRPRRNAA